VKDWVLHRWTGRLTTDLATAAAGGFLNRTTRSWDAETLARLDLAPAALPALCPPGEVVGRWAGVPVVAGITDGAAPHWAWQLGPAGVTCSLGTSGAIRRLAVDRGQPVASRGLFAYAVDDRRSLIGGAVSDAGNLLAWWAGVTRCSVRRIVEEAVREPVPRDLAVAPFWFGARSPYWDDRRGSVGGLTGTVRRPQLSAALLYGALAVLGETGQALAAVTGSYDRLHASGGLLSHPDLARVAASALGAPLRVARGWDASALGAARLAAEAVADPGPWPLPWTDVDPDPGLVDAIHAWAGRAGMGDGGERA
jgi:gluconokinase